MDQPKRLSALLSKPEDRAKAYAVVAEAENARARRVFDAGLEKVSAVILQAIDGGDCLRCGKPWEQIDVDNLFAVFTYYRPACSCYQHCRYCGKWFTEDREAGIVHHRCPGCEGDFHNLAGRYAFDDPRRFDDSNYCKTAG